MMLVDDVVWAAILVGGLVLSVCYGLSWGAVARAMADPKPAPTDELRGEPVADTAQDAQTRNAPADVLAEARP